MTATYMTTTEAAEYLRLSTGTLENYRVKGTGPAYHQRSRKSRVYYRREDLDAWLAGARKTNTSEVPACAS